MAAVLPVAEARVHAPGSRARMEIHGVDAASRVLLHGPECQLCRSVRAPAPAGGVWRPAAAGRSVQGAAAAVVGQPYPRPVRSAPVGSRAPPRT